MRLLRQLFALYSLREKIILGVFIILNIICSLLELIGIGAVIPFILLLTKPDAAQNNRYMKILYEWIEPRTYQSFVIVIAISFIVFFILKNLYMLCVFLLQQVFLRRKYVEMTDCLITSYLVKPYKYFFDHSGSEILRNIQSVNAVIIGMFTPLLNLLSEFVTIAIMAVFVLWLNPTLALCLGGGAMLLVWTGLRLLKKKTYQFGHELMTVNEQLISNVIQGFGSIKETMILGNERSILDRNHRIVGRLGKLNIFTNAMGVIPRFYIESLAVTAVILLMLLMLQAGIKEERIIIQLSLFGMVALRLMPSITRISIAIGNIRTYIPAFNHVYHDIIEAREIASELPLSNLNRIFFSDKIELHNVSFSYDGNYKVIEEANLTVLKNSRVGFVGPSGGGKTTMIDLIIGLLTPDSGSINIDGKDIQGCRREWQANVGYIPQKIFVYNDTVRANIALGVPPDNVNDDRVRQVIAMAQLNDFFDRQADGLDTVVGENGIKLSGGEIQRLGIARALYRDPEVLIMDEATSALDNKTEKEFMKAIDSLAGKKTIIIVAHRLTTVENCDAIYHIESGKVTKKERNR